MAVFGPGTGPEQTWGHEKVSSGTEALGVSWAGDDDALPRHGGTATSADGEAQRGAVLDVTKLRFHVNVASDIEKGHLQALKSGSVHFNKQLSRRQDTAYPPKQETMESVYGAAGPELLPCSPPDGKSDDSGWC